MRASTAIAVLCCAFPAPALCQGDPRPSIQGLVIDSVSGGVIPDAMVLLEGHDHVLTDAGGRYFFRDSPAPGEYVVAAVTRDCRIGAARLSALGSAPVRLDLRIGLQRLEGAEAALTAARSSGSASRVMTRDEIQALGEPTLAGVLRRMTPALVGPDRNRPGATVQLRERGVSTVMGSRTPLILVDGIRVADPRILESIDPKDVTRIEVAAGATGGWQWGIEGASGVIQIRTHEGDLARDPYCGAASRRR